MTVLILEVCRSPEIAKQTEAVVLSEFFDRQQIDYQLCSNDEAWPEPVTIDRSFLKQHLQDDRYPIIHLAMHGDDYGLILKWSCHQLGGKRIPEDTLLGSDIVRMPEWRGKVIVSGACSSSKLAHHFLSAGAEAVVAPTEPITWPDLGQFFSCFYNCYFQTDDLSEALAEAVEKYPAYACYSVHTSG